ncbi:anti-sigma factor [Hymenobacter latericus]|uniref:anti-sigma factor n=1 Tax=Hymenobacter sp. YIM 151858-1 TaxID=2987688 RepID=UPI002225FCE9|nr:anti-sigma factor [Hymenobacter sp. YIM 151858-1]UYZ58956.1 anti-sigma factor [Hymenobacter sp. YIM 151858-1]
MKPNSGLEGFVERHRADLDSFEPRADLWDAIEARLDEPADEDETPTHVLPLNPTVAPTHHTDTPAATTPSFAWQRYVAAAAVAIMLLAGGYGLRRADELNSLAGAVASADYELPAMEQQPNAVAEVVGAPEPMAVSAGQPAEQRLASSVRRMEAYYASQILEKQHELRQLDESATPGTMPQAADWKHELTALDSTYRQLRTELYRNPDPDAVLEAMNRNLQIRLDILNQQLRTREQIRQYHDESYAEASK